MKNTKSTLANLLGSASFLTIASSLAAHAQVVAQAQMAQAAQEEVPEQVLITGSLIRGTVAVGVPVTNLSPQDFVVTGSLTTADLFRSVPSANLNSGQSTQASRGEKGQKVNIRGFDSGTATRSLMMIDGLRFPAAGVSGNCALDPSIIPALAMERLDVLVDGASATYGSDAVAGVINIILKRNYDGAVTQLRYQLPSRGGDQTYAASQLWGRTWDGGGVTLTYEWYEDTPAPGSKFKDKWRNDYTPWGLNDRRPLNSSVPATLSTGAPTQPGTNGLPSQSMVTGCTNCFAVPVGTGFDFRPTDAIGTGPTAAGSAPTLSWNGSTFLALNNAGAAATGALGTRNVFDPFNIATFLAENQRNAAVITFDQRLTQHINLFGNGFYNNRRSQGFLQPLYGQNSVPSYPSFAVPSRTIAGTSTANPYYPTSGAGVCTTNPSTALPLGTPAGCVPNNLRAGYQLGIESPTYVTGWETGMRYHFGLNIDLPGDWASTVYLSKTRAQSKTHQTGTPIIGAVSAALGWVMPASPAAGTTPGIASWVKPASIPYLNLFCDPRAFQCNSPATLNYIAGFNDTSEITWVDEKGINFDGPLFDVPAGQVKMAVGAQYFSTHLSQARQQNTGGPTLIAPYNTYDYQRNFWAVFTQLNIPVIGDANALPGIANFDFEASWRHDQYADLGLGTSNPKVAFNWTVDNDIGLIVRGTWGNSFRAPGFGELSPLGQATFSPQNLPALGTSNTLTIACNAEVGSGAYKLLHPTVGPAFNGGACGSGPGALATPAFISETGSSLAVVAANWRKYVNTEQAVLKPETAFNWALGLQFAPTTFLQGLNVEVSWYMIKLTNQLTAAGQPSGDSVLNQAPTGFAWIVPTDLYQINPACNDNNNPATCPEFQEMILGALAQPTNLFPADAASQIRMIYDGGTVNKGYQRLQGYDFDISYDWDMAGLGAFNAGVTGTYYKERISVLDPANPIILDCFDTTIAAVGGIAQEGVPNTSRLRYRARLGWADAGFSAALFMDYQSHLFHSQAAPPNVNFQCQVAGGTVGGGSFPCLINNYTNIQPSTYTFDLSLGYQTGESPANDYLKNIAIQLVTQNIFDRTPAFQYRIATGGGQPGAFDISKQYQGRTISIILTKTW